MHIFLQHSHYNDVIIVYAFLIEDNENIVTIFCTIYLLYFYIQIITAYFV